MKKDTWFLVANSSLARIYKVGHNQSLVEVEVLEHPESRLHNQDLVSDRPGRDFESSNPSRHAIEPRTWPKQHEVDTFAKILARHLEGGLTSGAYDKLYISASPNLLGLIRQALSANIIKHVAGEIDKDLTHMKPDEIVKQVPFLFYS